MSFSDIRVLGTHSGAYLADLIVGQSAAKMKRIKVTSTRFANSEIKPTVESNIRHNDVYIVSTGFNDLETHWSINDHLMELYLLLDNVSRSDPKSVTVIIPFLPYLRQDKRMTREPLSAAFICNTLSKMANRVITMDAHFAQFQCLFSRCNVINVYARNLLTTHLLHEIKISKDTHILVSPDTGGGARIESYSRELNIPYAVLSKKRSYKEANNVLETVLHSDEDVCNKIGIIVDDMIDTGGTICSATETLVKHGIKKCILVATHGILSGPAIDRLNACDSVERVVVTNSLPQAHNVKECSKIEVVDISVLLKDLIHVIKTKGCVSEFLPGN